MVKRRQIKQRRNSNTLIWEYFIDDGTKPYSKTDAEAEIERLEEEDREIEKKKQSLPKQIPVNSPAVETNNFPLPEVKQFDDNSEDEDEHRQHSPRL